MLIFMPFITLINMQFLFELYNLYFGEIKLWTFFFKRHDFSRSETAVKLSYRVCLSVSVCACMHACIRVSIREDIVNSYYTAIQLYRRVDIPQR